MTLHQSLPAYEFYAPGNLTFGWGRRGEVGRIAARLGKRAFVVSGSKTLEAQGAIAEIVESVRHAGLQANLVTTISHEPEVDDIDRTTAALRRLGAGAGDLVLAVGGGSALDLGKAVAALVANDPASSVRDYLEGVGKGLTIDRNPLPLLAVPTTAGTGSEATKNAVVSCYDPPFKKSLRCDRMIPDAVLIDPELTIGLPTDATARSGMDAITQLIESFLSRRAKPIPQALALQGLRLAMPALSQAVQDPTCRWARESMSHAALLSGLALANSGLGMAHGVAAAMGAQCRVPHGLACAILLPVALRVNLPVCEGPMAELASVIDGPVGVTQAAEARRLIECVERLARTVGIPNSLAEIGVDRARIPDLVRGSRGNSMSGNPRELSDDELTEVLEAMR